MIIQKNTTSRFLTVPLISDGTNTGFKTVLNPDYVDPCPSSPSYTLAELRGLTKQFLDDMQNHGHATTYGPNSLTDWKFETFLQWLAKREREGRDAGEGS